MEYSRYYTNINLEWVHNSTESGDLFSYTNGAYEFSVEFCVVKFSSFGKDSMDYGIRSGKSLSLGIPMAPQDKFKGNQKPKLGDAPEGIPSFVFIHR